MAKVKKMAFGGLSGVRKPPIRIDGNRPGMAVAGQLGTANALAPRVAPRVAPSVAGPAIGAAPSSGGLLQALKTQQKFNPVSAGKLDTALGGGNTFSKLAAAKPMSGPQTAMLKKGGKVKAKSSASKRADGIATKGKTRGKMI